MTVVADVLVGLVALLHVYILVLEMFLWTAPRTRAGFGTTAEFAESTRTLAANQGLYNGFLALALAWGLITSDPTGFQLKLYGLTCVIIAGLYGAATASKRILLDQVLPGALALGALLLAR
jgi:putative membrane protein